VNLEELVKDMGGLHCQIADNLLSAGQSQLLCLARALLRDARVLVLDEASASLDLQSDLLMKKVINERFKDCTTITIAHRLNSVLGSDRIMVLDAGKLVEFDSPAKLIEQGGFLAKLFEDATTMTRDMRDGQQAYKIDTLVNPDESKEGPAVVATSAIQRVS